MIVATERKKQFGQLYVLPPNSSTLQCTPWGYCQPAGSGTRLDNIIGSSAYTLSCIFGKAGCTQMGAQYAGPPTFGQQLSQYIPLFLLFGGGMLLVSVMRH